MKRVIICGSRDFPDEGLVKREICSLVSQLGDVTIVHGGCPTGADAFADRWALDRGASAVEVHHADWSQGKKGGPLRNQAMADKGADLCLAFFTKLEDSRGTADMCRRARKAGIPVNWREPGTPWYSWEE